MARPKSEAKHQALLKAATHIISVRGLSVSTAQIAKVANVANGSLFTYLGTKTDARLTAELKNVGLGRTVDLKPLLPSPTI